MSMPNIPNIEPKINLCKEDVINILYMSVGMQEMSLSHILNAQGEILQQVIIKNESNYCLKDLININESVNKVTDKVYNLEKLFIEKINAIKEI